MIELRGISIEAGGFSLRDISFEVGAGEFAVIMGKTGSGKSTLMDLLIGLLEPTSGSIRIDDTPLTSKNRAAWQKLAGEVKLHMPNPKQLRMQGKYSDCQVMLSIGSRTSLIPIVSIAAMVFMSRISSSALC